MKPPRTTDEDIDTLIMDIDENGEPVPFETVQDAMRALESIHGSLHPDHQVQLHNGGCEGEDGCMCPFFSAAELMPKVHG